MSKLKGGIPDVRELVQDLRTVTALGMGVYSLFDRKVREFGPPAIARNDETLLRELGDRVRSSPNSMMAQHPEDFDVMRVGEFFLETGYLAGVSGPPVLVINLETLLLAQQREENRKRSPRGPDA